MCPTAEISQTAGLGSHDNTFIAQQNVNEGLSINEAVDIAFRLFHEYYPQLKKEALADVRKWLDTYLQTVLPQDIAPPSSRIAVPALQNASITEEPEIRQMYAALLANSMNKVVKNGVHPGFVEIIKQLCPDEAKILRYMATNPVIPIITLRMQDEKGEGYDLLKRFSDIGERASCENPYEINKYFDNLIRLGILETPGELSSLANKSLYDVLKNHSYIAGFKIPLEYINPELYKTKFQESFIKITDYGNAFCKICLGAVDQ